MLRGSGTALIAALAGSLLGASPLERVHVEKVAPFTSEVHLQLQGLPQMCGVSGVFESLAAPSHGTITRVGAEFVYRPGDGFWSVGQDSVDYTVVLADRARAYCAVVFDAARPPVSFAIDFGPNSFPWSAPEPGVYNCGPEFGCAPPPHGGGATGGGAGVKIRIPPGGGPLPPSAPSPARVMRATSGEPGRALTLALDRDPEGHYFISARLEDGAVDAASKTAPLGAGLHEIQLDWWGGYEGLLNKARMLVDGRRAGELSGTLAWPTDVQVDSNPAATAGGELTSAFVLQSLRQDAVAQLVVSSPTRIRTDFEGSLAPWQAVETWAMRRVLAPQPVRGSELALSWPALQPAPWPAAILSTRRFNLRMRLRSPSTNSGTVALLSGFGSQASGPVEVLRLSDQHKAGEHSLLVRVHGDPSSKTVSVPLPDASQFVAVQWRSATSDGDDGTLRVWVDGFLALDTGLELGGPQTLDSLSLGAKFGGATGQGTLYLDDIEVWY